jgi:hypothetical protein
VITVEEARARGIALPADEDAAQAIVDEQEAWLARRIGPLDEEITETFYVGVVRTSTKLGLRRYTDAVVVTDGGVLVDEDELALLDNGSSVGHVYGTSLPLLAWRGPYVSVVYTPTDELEVRRALYGLLSLETDPLGSELESETLGDYSYTRGGRAVTPAATRAALVSEILPKRDQALSVLVAVSRRLGPWDPVINAPEPPT